MKFTFSPLLFYFLIFYSPATLYSMEQTDDDWITITEMEYTHTSDIDLKQALEKIQNEAREYAYDRIKNSIKPHQQHANNEVCARKFRNLFDKLQKLSETSSTPIDMISILGFSITERQKINTDTIAHLTKNLIISTKNNI